MEGSFPESLRYDHESGKTKSGTLLVVHNNAFEFLHSTNCNISNQAVAAKLGECMYLHNHHTVNLVAVPRTVS